VVAVLVKAGADVNAGLTGGPHRETPLHWTASSDDVAVIDALFDRGADIEARGPVITGGTATRYRPEHFASNFATLLSKTGQGYELGY
jgi:ankyrin repeat protein